MGVMAWTRGNGLKWNRRDFCGHLPGTRCVHPDLSGRDDRWGRPVSGRKRGESVPFQGKR
jgi:hypothetical protein